MSLLIDALKQAEAARRQAEQYDAGQATEGLSLEPREAATTETEASSPSLPHSEQAIYTRSRPTRPTAHKERDRREVVRDYFEVKQAPKNHVPLIIAVLALLAFAGGAAYLWWATQPRGLQPGPALTGVVAPPVFDAPTATAGEHDASKSEQPHSSSETVSESATSIAPPAAAALPAARPTMRAAPRNEEIHTTGASRPEVAADPPSVTPLNANALRPDAPALRRTPEASRPGTSRIEAAYDAYRAGDLALARTRYRDLVRQEPRNVDALNALGMIALRDGQADSAEFYFRESLAVDPKDATAVSQLALLYGRGDAMTAETRLRGLVGAQPQSAAAHFALGTLYVQQQRWSEAQQSFFQAYTFDPSNPDVLFNLAVALDQLGQPRLALQYYQLATQASDRRPANFDPAVARARLESLQAAAAATSAPQ